MKFHRGQDDDDLKGRWLSDTGRWELGFQARTFGRIQLAMGLVGDSYYTLQYCCGDDPNKSSETLILVMLALRNVPESISERELYKFFPAWKVRPVYDDAELWSKLEALATA